MAKRKLGKASITSATRMIVESVAPPKYPATAPSSPPTTNARDTEAMATTSETRAP